MLSTCPGDFIEGYRRRSQKGEGPTSAGAPPPTTRDQNEKRGRRRLHVSQEKKLVAEGVGGGGKIFTMEYGALISMRENHGSKFKVRQETDSRLCAKRQKSIDQTRFTQDINKRSFSPHFAHWVD